MNLFKYSLCSVSNFFFSPVIHSRFKSWDNSLTASAIIIFSLSLTACGGGDDGGSDSTDIPASRTAISEVVFSDPSLATCVTSEASQKGFLFTDELTTLDCSQSNIRLLDGLKSFTKLETLNLSSNKISDISPLSAQTSLKVLDLSEIATLRKVDILLSLNKLTTVNFSESGRGNLECDTLDSLSQIASSITRPATCKKLITDVVFADDNLQSCVTALANETGATFTRDVKELNCINAGITQLDGIESFENLISININGNQVSDLTPLSDATKLQFVYVADNLITDIFALSELPALTLLDLSRIAGLTNLDALVNSTTLEELILVDTGNGDLGCSALDTLSTQLPALKRPLACDILISDVVFENNNLETCVLAEATRRGLTRTSEFTILNSCQFMSITSLVGMEKFTNLEFIDFTNTGVSDLAPLGNLLKLRGLNLDNNLVRDFKALNQLTELRQIEARNNSLLEDVSTILYMENVRFLHLTGSGNAVFTPMPCDVIDQLEVDILSRVSPTDPTSISVFEGPGPGLCDNTPTPGFNANAQADMDNNGQSDILLETVGLSSWRIGASDTSNPNAPIFNQGSLFEDNVNARAIAVADANNDDNDDLLIQVDNVDGSRGWQVLSSDGVGQLTKLGTLISITGEGVADDARAVAFKDIDADGNADIVIQTQVTVGDFSFVKYYTSFGTGTGYTILDSFDSSYSFAQSSGRAEIIALEDVNNDGTSDLVFSRMLDDKYCFFVRVFKNGAFEAQSSSSECASTKVFKGNKIEIVGVADITGNGLSELIVRKSNSGRNNWFFYSLTQGVSGTEWTKAAVGLLTTDLAVGSTERTITLADLNKDGRVDILNEITQGTLRTWVAYIANDYGLFDTQTWMTSDDSRIQDKHRRKTLGVRDYNGDGFPDLLLESSTETIAQLLTVQLNIDGTSFNAQQTVWHSSVLGSGRTKVIGVEENGLTNIAKDDTSLIAWAGVADKLYTRNEFSAILSAKGVTLQQGAALNQPLKEGECSINYGDASVDNNEFSVSAQAGFGLLVCNQRIGDRLSLKTQVIFGGCSTTAGLTGLGAKCEAGIYKGKMALDLGEGFEQELEVKLPNAEACGGVNTSYVCAELSAELASVSAKAELAGVGGGAKLAIGVGIGGDFGIEDGVISGSIDLKFLVGGSIEFSLDYETTGKFFYNVGETSYIFVQNGAEELIKAAGPAIMDAANFTGDALEVVAGGSVFIVEGAGDIAIIVFEDIGGNIEIIFTEIASGLEDAAGAVAGAVIDIGESVVDGVGQAFDGVGDAFSGLF